MKRKILKIMGGFLLGFLVLVGMMVYFHFDNIKKLGTAELSSEFITDTIPFSYANSGHLLVEVKINGSKETYPFILDSGASNMLFTNHTSEFNIQEDGLSYGYGANGEYFFSGIGKLDEIQVGDVEFQNVGVKTTDFSFSCMDHIYGIIGIGIMRHLVWQIDFEKQIIMVSKNLKNLSFNSNKVELSLSENSISHHLKVPLRLAEKRRSVGALLDLGSNAGLTINESHFLKDERIPQVKAVQGKASEGLGDKESTSPTTKIYLLDTLALGYSKYQINKIPVYSHAESSNLIGLDILKAFRTTISWKDRKLILEPYPDTPSFISKTTGFAMHFDENKEKAVIVSVLTASPASELGLEVGSEILSINGEDLNRGNFCDYQSGIEGDTLRLQVVRRGVTEEFQLIKRPMFN